MSKIWDYKEPADELARGVMEGTIDAEALKERFRNIKKPEIGVLKPSPVESFHVSSGAMRVTDPCYDMDTWCAGSLLDVKDGEWKAFVGCAYDEVDAKCENTWSKRHIEKISTKLPQRSEVIRIFGDTEKDGTPKTEEELDYLAKFLAAMSMEDSISYLLLSESCTPKGRVNFLHVHHADFSITEMDDTWEESEIDVGVDSGQACFADLEWFAEYSQEGVTQERGGSWDNTYRKFCDKTLETKFGFGCLEHAAVSQSGYGDGSYGMYFKRDEEGKVIAARIVFIYQDPEEEEGDD